MKVVKAEAAEKAAVRNAQQVQRKLEEGKAEQARLQEEQAAERARRKAALAERKRQRRAKREAELRAEGCGNYRSVGKWSQGSTPA